MTKRKTPFFFSFKGLSNSPIFQYLNFSFHRHFKRYVQGSSISLCISGLEIVFTHQLTLVFFPHNGSVESLGVQNWDLLVKRNSIIKQQVYLREVYDS